MSPLCPLSCVVSPLSLFIHPFQWQAIININSVIKKIDILLRLCGLQWLTEPDAANMVSINFYKAQNEIRAFWVFPSVKIKVDFSITFYLPGWVVLAKHW